MIYIDKIKIVSKTYPSNLFDIGYEIKCSDVNLLVGNQGCGKSTLLQMISKNHSDLKLTFTPETDLKTLNSYYFDSETNNPRIVDPEMYTNISGESIGYGVGNGLDSRFRSHGEVLEELVIDGLKNAKNCIILLDEPESGLSITNQFRFIKMIQKAVSNGCQLFIATHCYPLIEANNVISLEHKETMSGFEFITKAINSAY